MKERPILFKPDMTRAILDDRKTLTRRIVKPQPIDMDFYDNRFFMIMPNGKEIYINDCPYGKVGDRLWVRETWCPESEDGSLMWSSDGETYSVLYKADGNNPVALDGDGAIRFNKDGSESSPWKPAIHMPKWAARIWLEIVEVRVERLQDITDEDAKEEGVITRPEMWDACYIDGFMRLWDSINEKRGYSWESNPLVWVIKFNRVSMKN